MFGGVKVSYCVRVAGIDFFRSLIVCSVFVFVFVSVSVDVRVGVDYDKFSCFPCFLFGRINVFPASCFCLAASGHRIACIWMALIFSDS